MTSPARAALPAALRHLPGAALLLSADGIVLATNGRLGDAAAARVGDDFALAIDADASRAKWNRLLATARASAEPVTAELILAHDDELRDPRRFTLVRDDDASALWLVEHPRDERLDMLREQVTGVNSELASAQRALLKEQRRLEQSLAEQARLAQALAEQKAEVERRNEALVVAARELERSNQALDEFAHAVSHDLKAPLRAIGHYARWVRESLGDAAPAEVAQHLTDVDAQVRRMRSLIDGAIAYARAGRVDAGAETIALGDLAREIVELLAPPPNVHVQVGDAMPVIRSARAPLRQVLHNLVDNAIKHAGGREAHVVIDARSAGDFVELSVADDGPGIAPALHERIWGLFNTLHASADAAEGTGIGLALVRRIAEAHGGRAWVESEAGRGATFRILWPERSGERPNDE